MSKAFWKLGFYFWGIVYGIRNKELSVQAEQCWRDNEIFIQTQSELTPKEAVLWYLGWRNK